MNVNPSENPYRLFQLKKERLFFWGLHIKNLNFKRILSANKKENNFQNEILKSWKINNGSSDKVKEKKLERTHIHTLLLLLYALKNFTNIEILQKPI